LSSGSSQILDKSRVAASFLASSETYEEHAVVQKAVSLHLLSLLENLLPTTPKTFPEVLEIGCCTGFLTEKLVRRFSIETIFLNDLVSDFCLISASRIDSMATKAEILAGDIEGCLIPCNLNLVISSSTLQWMTDLPLLLERIFQALSPQGVCAFSIFGPGTMKEIAQLTGRCLEYRSMLDISGMVGGKFTILAAEQEQHVLYFPSVRGVLRHIKDTGVSGVSQKERWTNARLRQFEREYVQQFGSDAGLPVTYESIYVVAQKKL